MRVIAPLVLTILALAAASPTLAGHDLGPATPQSLPGKISLGAGYCYQTSEWELDTYTLDMADVHQNFWYAGVTYGFAPGWEGYLRAGASDLTAKGGRVVTRTRTTGTVAFGLIEKLEMGFKPYLTLGLRGAFYRRPELALGTYFQFNYYSNNVAEETGTFWDFEQDVVYRARVEFENRYDLNLGLNADLIGDWGIFYIGTFYFKAAGKASGRLELDREPPEEHTFDTDIEEKGIFGINAGLRIIVRKGWYIASEWHYKPGRLSGSISVSLNRAFGP